jgi:hypothetical protein
MKTIIALLFMLLLLMTGRSLRAQDSGSSDWGAVADRNTTAVPITPDPLAIANEYIHAHLGEWGLTPQDLNGMTVNDRYTDQSSGITRVYFLQRYQGIPVYNAILNISITKTGTVFFAGNRFVPDLAGKVNTTEPVLSAQEAVMNLADHLGLPREALLLKKQTEASQVVFDKGSIAREDITVMLCYQPDEGKALLAWDILFAPAGKTDKWSTRVPLTALY